MLSIRQEKYSNQKKVDTKVIVKYSIEVLKISLTTWNQLYENYCASQFYAI